MLKDSFLSKEIGSLLAKVREKSGLSQIEVAKRIGLSKKSGQGYLSRLEKGKTKNPPIQTILLYLRACGASWVEFFQELDRINFKQRHEKVMAQLTTPPDKRKIERDVMRYEVGIEMPSKEKEEIDWERLKNQIKNKLAILLTKNQIGEKEVNSYQNFASEYFDFLAELNKPGMKMVTEKYQRAGLQFHLLFKIKKIINLVLRGEIKRLESKKPLPTEKQAKMAIGLAKYRIRIEQVESNVHKLLCEIGVQPPWFVLYKDFAREYYKTLKRYYGKLDLSPRLAEIVKRWTKEGLKEDILVKVSKVIEKMFEKSREGI